MPWNIVDTWRSQRLNVANGAVTGTLKCMLVTGAWTPNQNTDEFITVAIAAEVVGTNYTARGNALTGYSTTMTGAGLITIDANDPATWLMNAAGFANARKAILYWDTGVNGTSRMFCYSDDFGSDKGNTGGDFSIILDALGIVTCAR